MNSQTATRTAKSNHASLVILVVAAVALVLAAVMTVLTVNSPAHAAPDNASGATGSQVASTSMLAAGGSVSGNAGNHIG